jgi:hypothetical protein
VVEPYAASTRACAKRGSLTRRPLRLLRPGIGVRVLEFGINPAFPVLF